VICWAPIPLDSDPAICSEATCAEKQEKREASRKRLTVMLYLFPGIAILLVMLQLMGASG
jgi:predicted nucleic acid-binding Zn ribbon protein